MTVDDRRLDVVEDFSDLVLHEIPQALAMPRAASHGVHDALSCRDADVRGDQKFLERFDGVDVDRPRTLLFGIGLLDDLFAQE